MKGLKTQEIKHGVQNIIMHELELPGQLESNSQSLGSRAILGSKRAKNTGDEQVSKRIS